MNSGISRSISVSSSSRIQISTKSWIFIGYHVLISWFPVIFLLFLLSKKKKEKRNLSIIFSLTGSIVCGGVMFLTSFAGFYAGLWDDRRLLVWVFLSIHSQQHLVLFSSSNNYTKTFFPTRSFLCCSCRPLAPLSLSSCHTRPLQTFSWVYQTRGTLFPRLPQATSRQL